MKFICPECREAIDSADWDKEIQSMFGGTINSIESYMKNHSAYKCPACGEVIYGKDIKDLYNMI